MSLLRELYETLNDYYAAKPPMVWWSDSPLEVIVGSILVQASTWKSVEAVLQRFRELKLLDFRKIIETADDELAQIVRPVGFASRRVKCLKAVAQLFLVRANGDTAVFFARSPDVIRKELLDVSGIGAATADNILLYAGNLPIYIVDPYTRRIFERHGIISTLAKDADIQSRVHEELTPIDEPCEAKLYSKFQELIVRVGREFCGKSQRQCDLCPLRSFLPQGAAQALAVKSETKAQATSIAKQPERSVSPSTAAVKPVELPLDLDDRERQIIEAIGEGVQPIDTVADLTLLPVHIVRATIAVLEMKRLVKQIEGNQVRRA